MKIAIIGAGAMGLTTVFYLLNKSAVKDILLIDNNTQQLALLVKRLNSLTSTKKLQTLCLNVNNQKSLIRAINSYDIIIGTVPWQSTVKIIKAALATNKPFISITRPDYAELEKLQAEVISNHGNIMLGCGLEPGLTEICANYIAENFLSLDSLHIRCGGNPINPIPPLCYKSTFTRHRLPIDLRDAYFIEYGKLKSTQRFSDVENIDIPGIGKLEAWHDGMLPWLIELPNLNQTHLCTQKTLRWPGFAKKVSTLATLGLLDQQPIEVNGKAVSPRQVVEAVLKPTTTFTEQDRDIVILQILASGILKNGFQTDLSIMMYDYFDENTGFTALARTTGYTVAICAMLMLSEPSLAKGLIRPEQFFVKNKFEQLMNQLATSNINFNFSGRLL